MNAKVSTAGSALNAMLDAARTRTLALVANYTSSQWLGPRLATVNPPLWEIGHLGWFQEHWCLRRGNKLKNSLLANADALYDSALVPHQTRWDLPLPDVPATLRYLNDVLEKIQSQLAHTATDPELSYFAQLCAYHEEMHCEALTYTQQTLAYPHLPGPSPANAPPSATCAGDAEITGGKFHLGAAEDATFVFDNEKWAHAVEVRPFHMARTPVTNAQFAEFVGADGYQDKRWWSRAGWAWRSGVQASAPLYWHRTGNTWLRRRFDLQESLPADEPVMHVSWFEATAWCRWAGRRLPTEAEWEFAAATEPQNPAVKRRYPWGNSMPAAETASLYDTGGRNLPVGACANGDSAWGIRQMIGNVWEWTADWFQPYPGFVRDPYAEYSEPWFGNHKVLRGGCHMTRSSLIRNTWRNFYTPDRRDVYAGFRSCAL